MGKRCISMLLIPVRKLRNVLNLPNVSMYMQNT